MLHVLFIIPCVIGILQSNFSLQILFFVNGRWTLVKVFLISMKVKKSKICPAFFVNHCSKQR